VADPVRPRRVTTGAKKVAWTVFVGSGETDIGSESVLKSTSSLWYREGLPRYEFVGSHGLSLCPRWAASIDG
jgi:hypothetical protein